MKKLAGLGAPDEAMVKAGIEEFATRASVLEQSLGANGMLGSSHDSDDMVQETFVRAFRAQHTLEDPATARAWLHRIATNVCIDELRSARDALGAPNSGRRQIRICRLRHAPRTPSARTGAVGVARGNDPGFTSASSHAAFFANGLRRTIGVAPA